MNTFQFGQVYPEMYNALPSAYREDECLEFITCGGKWFCYPKAEQVMYVGEWQCMWDKDNHTWVQVD